MKYGVCCVCNGLHKKQTTMQCYIQYLRGLCSSKAPVPTLRACEQHANKLSRHNEHSHLIGRPTAMHADGLRRES